MRWANLSGARTYKGEQPKENPLVAFLHSCIKVPICSDRCRSGPLSSWLNIHITASNPYIVMIHVLAGKHITCPRAIHPGHPKAPILHWGSLVGHV